MFTGGEAAQLLRYATDHCCLLLLYRIIVPCCEYKDGVYGCPFPMGGRGKGGLVGHSNAPLNTNN